LVDEVGQLDGGDIDELEAGLAGVIRIDVGIADVNPPITVPLVAMPRQMVLAADEVHLDSEPGPHPLLLARCPVRGTADDVAVGQCRSNNTDRDRTGRLPDLERAVDVEADHHSGRTMRHPITSRFVASTGRSI
jgi:hypothetical protein